MAGRPRTKYRRVREMTTRAHELCEELWALMPRQYDERPNPADRLCVAWRDAMRDVVGGWEVLEALGELLAKKVRVALTESDPLEIDGETKSVAEWAELYEIPPAVILTRIRDGLDAEPAVISPLEGPSGDDAASAGPAEEPTATASPTAADEQQLDSRPPVV